MKQLKKNLCVFFEPKFIKMYYTLLFELKVCRKFKFQKKNFNFWSYFYLFLFIGISLSIKLLLKISFNSLYEFYFLF